MKKLYPVRLLLILCLATLVAAQPTRGSRRAASTSAHPAKAVEALFVNSDLDRARQLTALPSRAVRSHADLDSLFVAMEAAAIEADTAVELEAALRLCEARPATTDPRVNLAAARIMDLAGNTTQFRTAIPRIRSLIASSVPQKRYLQAALITAASEGAPDVSLLQITRDSGLITDWRLVGPFGKFANIAFDQSWPPEHDALMSSRYEGLVTETLRFENGTFTLPEYFNSNGVLYAAAEVRVPAGRYRLRAESGGTLAVMVDGTKVLTKDDRFRATAEIAWQNLELSAGTHRVLVKFIASGAPFRAALLSVPTHPAATPARIAFESELQYVQAAERYWAGDYSGAITDLNAMLQQQPSAIGYWLLADVWSHMAQDTPEQLTALRKALELAPHATAAEYALAARAFSEGKFDDAYEKARHVAETGPEFIPNMQLLAAAATRLKWNTEASAAIDAHIRVHPTCEALRDAVKFYDSISAYERSSQIGTQLQNCAPGSLDYAQMLSDSGRHDEAAVPARRLIAANPYDRDALAFLVEQLAASGQHAEAEQQARALIALAPNSQRFQQLADSIRKGNTLADENGASPQELAADEQFYTAYKRNAFQIIKQTKDRHFSGGPILILLHDRVARLNRDGKVSLYVHKVTRLLGRDGIEQYGEVPVPADAEILELRTIKADGTVVEPEFNQHKATVSMPALAPGDVIEEEYVIRYREGGLADHSDAFQFTFGSFNGPILYARFAAITPPTANLDVAGTGEMPKPAIQDSGLGVARVWERDNIAQAVREVAMPRNATLPAVRLIPQLNGWTEVRDHYRNALIEAARIGARVEQAAATLTGSDEQRARMAYHFVTSRVRPAGSPADMVPAEDTLATLSGNRTALLVAIARAAGLKADVILTRNVDDVDNSVPSLHAYTHPLVLFRFADQNTLVDVESDGIPFGAVPPTADRTHALLVPVDTPTAEPLIALNQLLPPATNDRSEAEAEVRFNDQGDLEADLKISMGTWRGAQMRNILAGVQPNERKHFFEQLAGRIFPGVSEADGEVRNEFENEKRLELSVHCRAPRFLTFRGDYADMDQLAPALGLRKMYLGNSDRKMPLSIDVPLDEAAVFHVHLPQGLRVLVGAPNFSTNSEFGQYAVTFSQPAPGQIDIRREFRVPVQLVTPTQFNAFATFARQVDDAERQRITLERTPVSARSN